MTDQKSPEASDKGGPGQSAKGGAARALRREREAAALRANLKRRKTRERALADSEAGGARAADGDDSAPHNEGT